MKFFNIDMHISVISDIKRIFNKLGHLVDSISLSNHSYVIGEEKGKLKLPINVADCWNPELWENFYKAYKKELSVYDGFIACYPPAFAMLYTKFDKPIIMQVPIRYEYPWSGSRSHWDKFNNWIANYPKLYLCANNRYDKWWIEKNTGKLCTHIPSLCEYTDCSYNPEHDAVLVSMKKDIPGICDSYMIKKEDVLKPGYKWSDLVKYKGVVHIPYQVSTMSIFEQYTANMPLFFPEPGYLRRLFKERLAMSETHWDKSQRIDWTKIILADYYDNEWMPEIKYFDNINRLKHLVRANLGETSVKMNLFNITRKRKVYEKWKTILKTLS